MSTELWQLLGSCQPLAALRKLTLRRVLLTHSHMQQLAHLTQLRALCLQQVDVRSCEVHSWACLSPLTCLLAFEFSEWNNPLLSIGNLAVLSDDSVARMAASWTHLQCIRYSGGVVISEAACRALSTLPHLECVDIAGTDGTRCIAPPLPLPPPLEMRVAAAGATGGRPIVQNDIDGAFGSGANTGGDAVGGAEDGSDDAVGSGADGHDGGFGGDADGSGNTVAGVDQPTCFHTHTCIQGAHALLPPPTEPQAAAARQRSPRHAARVSVQLLLPQTLIRSCDGFLAKPRSSSLGSGSDDSEGSVNWMGR